MVITLVAATNKKFIDIPVEKIKECQMSIIDYIHEKYPQIPATIEREKVLDDTTKQQILDAVDEYKKTI